MLGCVEEVGMSDWEGGGSGRGGGVPRSSSEVLEDGGRISVCTFFKESLTGFNHMSSGQHTHRVLGLFDMYDVTEHSNVGVLVTFPTRPHVILETSCS